MHRKTETLWHVELAVVVAIVMQIIISSHLTILPKYWFAGLELLLLVGLRVANVGSHDRVARLRRLAGISLTALVSFANIVLLIKVCLALVNGSHSIGARQLLLSGVLIYLTNIILFGLWYWQLDGGGPGGRGTHQPPVDFLFPQMTTNPQITHEPDWRPLFLDYLYISVTNSTAFSPTDALPLTHRAKVLMGLQAFVSFATIALVAARAVNILA